jgi:hypothetical protein
MLHFQQAAFRPLSRHSEPGGGREGNKWWESLLWAESGQSQLSDFETKPCNIDHSKLVDQGKLSYETDISHPKLLLAQR